MPSGESMLSVLKSNKNLKLIKENRFKSIAKWGSPKKTEYDFPKGTPQVLEELRERLKKERKQRFYKQMIVFIVMVSIISFLLFK
jgi:hypothetical protein